MNYRGVITDDELIALQARNDVRRGERVRELGTAHVLHASHAPTRDDHVRRCMKLPLVLVARAGRP